MVFEQSCFKSEVLPSQESDIDECFESTISTNANCWFQGDIIRMQEHLMRIGWTTASIAQTSTPQGKQNTSFIKAYICYKTHFGFSYRCFRGISYNCGNHDNGSSIIVHQR